MKKTMVKNSESKSDLPVLLPFDARCGGQTGFSAMLADIQPRHVIWLLLTCFAAIGVTESVAAGNAAYLSPFKTLARWIPFIMKGFMLNLVISFSAMAIGTFAGAIMGLMQVSLMAPVRLSSWVLTQFFRNSPWLVLLFCIMFMLPYNIQIGDEVIQIPDWIKATIGLALPIMANISEIVRGAVQSIPTGQWESAESLAFTRRQTMWMIILPQCIRRMIPPWMNWYAILTMATPLCSILGVEEAVRHSQQALEAEGARPELLMPFYSFLLVIFFVYCYPIARWTIRLEKKFMVKN